MDKTPPPPDPRQTVIPATLPMMNCPRCASPQPVKAGPGSGPHKSSVRCATCDRFLKWGVVK